jgi:hypothetical protein
MIGCGDNALKQFFARHAEELADTAEHRRIIGGRRI